MPKNNGSGAQNVSGSVSVAMAPGQPFYCSVGAHAEVDWNGTSAETWDEWHHFEGSYDVAVDDLRFSLR